MLHVSGLSIMCLVPKTPVSLVCPFHDVIYFIYSCLWNVHLTFFGGGWEDFFRGGRADFFLIKSPNFIEHIILIWKMQRYLFKCFYGTNGVYIQQYFIYIVITDLIVFITKICLEFTLHLVFAGNVIQYFNGN